MKSIVKYAQQIQLPGRQFLDKLMQRFPDRADFAIHHHDQIFGSWDVISAFKASVKLLAGNYKRFSGSRCRHQLNSRFSNRHALAAERRGFEHDVKISVEGAAPVVETAGIFCMSHGNSVARACASIGAVKMGKDASNLGVAHMLPFHFYTFDMCAKPAMNVFLSIKQLAVPGLLSMLFSGGCVDDSIVGGWSLGSMFAFYSALQLEACLAGPRALFHIDARSLAPSPAAHTDPDPTIFIGLDRELIGRANTVLTIRLASS